MFVSIHCINLNAFYRWLVVLFIVASLFFVFFQLRTCIQKILYHN